MRDAGHDSRLATSSVRQRQIKRSRRLNRSPTLVSTLKSSGSNRRRASPVQSNSPLHLTPAGRDTDRTSADASALSVQQWRGGPEGNRHTENGGWYLRNAVTCQTKSVSEFDSAMCKGAPSSRRNNVSFTTR